MVSKDWARRGVPSHESAGTTLYSGDFLFKVTRDDQPWLMKFL